MSRGTNARIRLGPLERAVMTALWAADQGGDVVSVHAAVGTPRAITRNTIHSTLERLIRKGLVVRQRRGRAYHYAARVSQSAWIAEVLDEVTAQLGAEDRHVVLAGFVDFAVRTGEDTLATLEAMLRDHRRRGDGGDE